MIYPFVIGANFYVTNQAFFISMTAIIYHMVSNIVLSFLFAIPLYLFVQAPISNVIKLISTRVSNRSKKPKVFKEEEGKFPL